MPRSCMVWFDVCSGNGTMDAQGSANIGAPRTASAAALVRLHATLQRLDGAPDAGQIEAIKTRIRSHLPGVDTARSQPHRKTPGGCTQVLHMNYAPTAASDTTETDYLRFYAQTLGTLGLRLEIVTDGGSREKVLKTLSDYPHLNYGVTLSEDRVSKWAEDSVEYLGQGHMAVLQRFDPDLLEWAMKTGRRERWQGKVSPELLEEILQDDHLWILMGLRVNELQTGALLEQVAQAKGQSVGHLRAYIEGGNMIAGEDAAGQPMVLVGKDAIAATAHIYQLSHDHVRGIICEDFGLNTIEQVVAVEQPGKFHLDMGLLFLGHGQVIVNNSKAALNDALEMADLVPSETTKKMAAKLKLQCSLEDDASQDLISAGLTVRREKLENDVFYNFFNGEFVTGADGAPYYITNGGFDDPERFFETLLVQELQVVKKVFFSPQNIAQKSLQERGGGGCRLKGSRGV